MREKEGVRELGQALQGRDIQEQQLAEIVQRAALDRIYSLYSSPSMSPLERAFTWLGGMCPSLSFQLIYALTSHQIQADLEELLQLDAHRHDVADGPASLASLSALQLAQLNDLQSFTIEEEDRVERETTKCSGSPLASSLSSSPPTADDDIHRSMDNAISKKLAFLQEICMQANSLCLSTFSRVLDLLHHPFQRAHYLLAAAKLQVALRHLGNAPAVARSPEFFLSSEAK